MEKFQNKYRIPSVRASWWDYRNEGAYFITICTSDRWHYFGKIRKGQMDYSPIGVIADLVWHDIKNHSSHVELGDFVVMPNHIHGILIITGDRPNLDSMNISDHFMSRISPESGSIPAIVRSYKSAVTRHAYRLGFSFKWQSRYHDHIIRNEEEYQRISNYIIQNPSKWSDDRFFVETLPATSPPPDI